MQIIEQEDIVKLEFELFKSLKTLSHGVICRKGGVSSFPYNSLNLNLDHPVLPLDIEENLNKITRVLKLERPIFAKQEHQGEIALVTLENAPHPFICDGFITDQPKMTLMVIHADCQAGLFYDPIKKVIANIHCGWRGNVLNIYAKAIEKMQQDYGCSPKDILVCISPSLGPNKAEFIHYQREFPSHFWPFRKEKDLFNLWEISKMQLLEAGILEDHIEIASICTYENKDLFFSYRGEKVTGRNISYLALQ